MKILTLSLENFGSFKVLDLNLKGGGLTLIHGATGSGKSTIMDAVYWTIFGSTARGGSVDDVKSWTSSGEPTVSTLSIELSVNTLTIYRSRGKQSENDLYWTEDGSDLKRRGKDISETQKLLEKRLGISADLYLYAAYFSEFSPTGSFFVAKAKERRELFENLASLEFPIKLAEKAADERKQLKKANEGRERAIAQISGRLDQIGSHIDSTNIGSRSWDLRQKSVISELRAKADNFERDLSRSQAATSQKLDALRAEVVPEGTYKKRILQLQAEKTCAHCGGVSKAKLEQIQKLNDLETVNKGILNQISILTTQLNQKTADNHYVDQITIEEKKSNPFEAQLKKLHEENETLTATLASHQSEYEAVEHKLVSLTQLYDLTFQLRGELLQIAIRNIQDATNTYLETYFDAPIRVQFSMDEGGDSLSVSITKSGYECGFKSLSKGQRGLLKLCFGVAVMEAASNRAGTHFDNLFFDESLDGMDSELKIKAFSLFEKLSTTHNSVMVIEHNEEFKTLFNKRYHVSLINDNSEITVE